MKHISTILLLCLPIGVIAGLWFGTIDEGFKMALTGLILSAVGMFLKFWEGE